MRIPGCLALNDHQKKILEKAINENQKALAKVALILLEENCCGGSPISFEITSDGLGDSVYAILHLGRGKTERVWLDDGLEP